MSNRTFEMSLLKSYLTPVCLNSSLKVPSLVGAPGAPLLCLGSHAMVNDAWSKCSWEFPLTSNYPFETGPGLIEISAVQQIRRGDAEPELGQNGQPKLRLGLPGQIGKASAFASPFSPHKKWLANLVASGPLRAWQRGKSVHDC